MGQNYTYSFEDVSFFSMPNYRQTVIAKIKLANKHKIIVQNLFVHNWGECHQTVEIISSKFLLLQHCYTNSYSVVLGEHIG